MQDYRCARRLIPLRPGVNGQQLLVIGFEVTGLAAQDRIDNLFRQTPPECRFGCSPVERCQQGAAGEYNSRNRKPGKDIIEFHRVCRYAAAGERVIPMLRVYQAAVFATFRPSGC